MDGNKDCSLDPRVGRLSLFGAVINRLPSNAGLKTAAFEPPSAAAGDHLGAILDSTAQPAWSHMVSGWPMTASRSSTSLDLAVVARSAVSSQPRKKPISGWDRSLVRHSSRSRMVVSQNALFLQQREPRLLSFRVAVFGPLGAVYLRLRFFGQELGVRDGQPLLQGGLVFLECFGRCPGLRVVHRPRIFQAASYFGEGSSSSQGLYVACWCTSCRSDRTTMNSSAVAVALGKDFRAFPSNSILIPRVTTTLDLRRYLHIGGEGPLRR